MQKILIVELADVKYAIRSNELQAIRKDPVKYCRPYGLANPCITGTVWIGDHLRAIADLEACLGHPFTTGPSRNIMLLPRRGEIAGFFTHGEVHDTLEEIESHPESVYKIPKFARSRVVDTCVVIESELIPLINISILHKLVQDIDYKPEPHILRLDFLEKSVAPTEKRMRRIQCGGVTLAAQASGTMEIIHNPVHICLFDTRQARAINGFLLVDQELIPLVNLTQKIQGSRRAPTSDTIIILQMGSNRIGFLVDADKGELEQGLPIMTLPPLIQTEWMREAFLSKNKVIPAIDLEKLVLSGFSRRTDFHDIDRGYVLFENTAKLVEFSVLGQSHAIPRTTVLEVLKIRSIKRIPNASRLIRGISVYKNEILPVLDLAVCYHKKSSLTAEWKMILVQTSGFRCLVLTEGPIKTRRMPAKLNQERFASLQSQFVHGSYFDSQTDSIIPILDTENITRYYQIESAEKTSRPQPRPPKRPSIPKTPLKVEAEEPIPQTERPQKTLDEDKPIVGIVAEATSAIDMPTAADAPTVAKTPAEESQPEETPKDLEEDKIEEAVVEEAVVEEAASEDDKIEEPIVEDKQEEALAEEAGPKDDKIEEPLVEKQKIEEPLAEEYRTDETIIEEEKREEAVAEKDRIDEPLVEEEDQVAEAVVEDDSLDETVIEDEGIDKTVAEETVSEDDKTDEETIEEAGPKDEKIEEPIVEKQKIEEPLAVDDRIEEPFVEEEDQIAEAVVEDDSLDETVVEETAAEDEGIDKTVAEEAVSEDDKTDEAIAEEEKREEAVAEDDRIDEAIVEETFVGDDKIEEPIVEKQKIEEPLAVDDRIEEPIVMETDSEDDRKEEAVVEEDSIKKQVFDKTVVVETARQFDGKEETVVDETVPVDEGVEAIIEQEDKADETVVNDDKIKEEPIIKESAGTEKTVAEEKVPVDDKTEEPTIEKGDVEETVVEEKIPVDEGVEAIIEQEDIADETIVEDDKVEEEPIIEEGAIEKTVIDETVPVDDKIEEAIIEEGDKADETVVEDGAFKETAADESVLEVDGKEESIVEERTLDIGEATGVEETGVQQEEIDEETVESEKPDDEALPLTQKSRQTPAAVISVGAASKATAAITVVLCEQAAEEIIIGFTADESVEVRLILMNQAAENPFDPVSVFDSSMTSIKAPEETLDDKLTAEKPVLEESSTIKEQAWEKDAAKELKEEEPEPELAEFQKEEPKQAEEKISLKKLAEELGVDTPQETETTTVEKSRESAIAMKAEDVKKAIDGSVPSKTQEPERKDNARKRVILYYSAAAIFILVAGVLLFQFIRQPDRNLTKRQSDVETAAVSEQTDQTLAPKNRSAAESSPLDDEAAENISPSNESEGFGTKTKRGADEVADSSEPDRIHQTRKGAVSDKTGRFGVEDKSNARSQSEAKKPVKATAIKDVDAEAKFKKASAGTKERPLKTDVGTKIDQSRPPKPSTIAGTAETEGESIQIPYRQAKYVVKKGDYLIRITRAHTGNGYDYPKIQKYNKIPNANLIFPDQIIKFKPEWIKTKPTPFK